MSKHSGCIFILVEISGFTTGSNVEDFNQTINFHDYLQDCISKEILIDGIQSGTDVRTEQFWMMRESITYASAKDGPQVKHDISIPISRIPEFVENISKKIKCKTTQHNKNNTTKKKQKENINKTHKKNNKSQQIL